MADGINGIRIDYDKMRDVRTNSEDYVLDGTNGQTTVDKEVVEHLKTNQEHLSNGATNEDGLIDAYELTEFINHLDGYNGNSDGRNDGIITDQEIKDWYNANKDVNGEAFIQRFGGNENAALNKVKSFLDPFSAGSSNLSNQTNGVKTNYSTNSAKGGSSYAAQDVNGESYLNNNRTYSSNGGYDSNTGQNYSVSTLNGRKYEIYNYGSDLVVKYGVNDQQKSVNIDLDSMVSSRNNEAKLTNFLKNQPGDLLISLQAQNCVISDNNSTNSTNSSSSYNNSYPDRSFSNKSTYSVTQVNGDEYYVYKNSHSKNSGYEDTDVTIYKNGSKEATIDLTDLTNTTSSSTRENIIDALKDVPGDMLLSWWLDSDTFKNVSSVGNAQDNFDGDYLSYDNDYVDRTFKNNSTSSTTTVDGETYYLYRDNNSSNKGRNYDYDTDENPYVTIEKPSGSKVTIDLTNLISSSSNSTINNLVEELKNMPADMLLEWNSSNTTFSSVSKLNTAYNNFDDNYNHNGSSSNSSLSSTNYKSPITSISAFEKFARDNDYDLTFSNRSRRTNGDEIVETYTTSSGRTKTTYEATKDDYNNTITIDYVNNSRDGRVIYLDDLVSTNLTSSARKSLINSLKNQPLEALVAFAESLSAVNSSSGNSNGGYDNNGSYTINVGTNPTTNSLANGLGHATYKNNSSVFATSALGKQLKATLQEERAFASSSGYSSLANTVRYDEDFVAMAYEILYSGSDAISKNSNLAALARYFPKSVAIVDQIKRELEKEYYSLK